MAAAKPRHVMVDLETTGVGVGCRILSIGAVAFDHVKGALPQRFYCAIDKESWPEGFFDSPDTMAWWDKQTPEARKEAFSGTESSREVLKEFVRWMASEFDERTIQVWAQGMDFDLPILSHALKSHCLPVPWRFYNGRDSRTMISFSGIRKPYRDLRAAHNAMEDCLYQIKCLQEVRKHLTWKP